MNDGSLRHHPTLFRAELPFFKDESYSVTVKFEVEFSLVPAIFKAAKRRLIWFNHFKSRVIRQITVGENLNRNSRELHTMENKYDPRFVSDILRLGKCSVQVRELLKLRCTLFWSIDWGWRSIPLVKYEISYSWDLKDT